jgi:hypothetical protein
MVEGITIKCQQKLKTKQNNMIQSIANISLLIIILVAGILVCDETGGG